MLKITAIGNLTNDVELKMNEATGKPYAILRIASDRRYRSGAPPLPGRAANWPLWVTLRRSPLRMILPGSRAS